MPPLGFGRKQEFQTFTTDITNKDDLKEIKKIRHMLNPNEEVFVVARQSRFKPGGSKFTPNVVFGTDRRIIIKDPRMLGLRENLVEIIRNGIDRDREVYRYPQVEQLHQQRSLSIADELMKFANLKEKGIISDDEF